MCYQQGCTDCTHAAQAEGLGQGEGGEGGGGGGILGDVRNTQKHTRKPLLLH